MSNRIRVKLMMCGTEIEMTTDNIINGYVKFQQVKGTRRHCSNRWEWL